MPRLNARTNILYTRTNPWRRFAGNPRRVAQSAALRELIVETFRPIALGCRSSGRPHERGLSRPLPVRVASSAGLAQSKIAPKSSRGGAGREGPRALDVGGRYGRNASISARATCGAATLVPFIRTDVPARVPAAGTPISSRELSAVPTRSGQCTRTLLRVSPADEYLAYAPGRRRRSRCGCRLRCCCR
jgi:hypothetical protein